MKSFFLIISALLFTQPSDEWKTIHTDRLYSVSGIAPFKDGYLVVVDNKKKGQPRISYIDRELKIHPVAWPARKLPYDLEAIIMLPGNENRFILMESTGICYELDIDSTSLQTDLIHSFTLPNLKPTMNLEGLTIFPSGQGLVFIYGDRGSDKRKSTLFTAFFNPKKRSFYEVSKFTVDLPKPKNHKRNIADLTIKANGSVWTSATSDPSDNGPFTTAIYELGEIDHAGTFTPIHPELQQPIMVFGGQKVEAMIFHNGHLVLMTDNENFGATFKQID